jgi:ribosome-associated protein
MKHNNETLADENLDTELSKTKRKQQVEALQDLGVKLVKTSNDKLKKIEMPDVLLQAIKEAQKITSNGALRRQYQYIGKLMRNVDAAALALQLDYINGDSVKSTQIFHLAEQWRTKLLAADDNLNSFIAAYPNATNTQITELRSLTRIVRKEQQLNTNRNFTKFFRLIRSIIEGQLI